MDPIILPRISDQKPLVSVVSITYNHEPYIRDCLDGFLMQKTDFPIEIIIHDDASTDHTADILREYYEKRPDLFHVIIERENQYSQNKDICWPLYEQAQGEYIAICEGDDYWTDPLKLQKQFDFLESNPDYSCCFHNYDTLYSDKNEIVATRNLYKNNNIIDLRTAIINGTKNIHVCTEFFLKKAIDKYGLFRKDSPVGDYPLQVCLAAYGNIFYLDESMAVYRKNIGCSWTSRFKQADEKVKINYARRSIKNLINIHKQLNGYDKELAARIGKAFYLIYTTRNNRKAFRNRFIIEYIRSLSLFDRIKVCTIILLSQEKYNKVKNLLYALCSLNKKIFRKGI